MTETPSSSDKGVESREGEGLRLLGALQDRKKEQEWARWAEEQYIRCKSARSSIENQWNINLAMVNGKQYIAPVSVAGQGMRLRSPKAAPWRVRLIINKIRMAIRTECAKLASSRPIPVVVPATTEDEDVSAARVAESILKAEFATADFERTYRDWIWWGSVCGNSFLKSYWDSSAPDSRLSEPSKPMLGKNGQSIKDETGRPIMVEGDPVLGKVCVERVTPYHLFVPDLLSPDINKQPYVIHVMTRSKLWVEKAFPHLGKVNCDVASTTTILDAAFTITKGGDNQVLDSVMVKEVWIKPGGHKDFPKGGMLTIINGRVAQKKREWPWPFPEYPFYKYDGIPTGGFYSASIIEDLIPLQKEYNRTRSQMVEIKNTIGRPKLLYQQGSINPRQVSSEPGQGIPYKPGYEKPSELRGAEYPQSMIVEMQTLKEDFDDISGQHEISRGRNPEQVTSGVAISFLQEQDDVKLNYQVASIEYAVETMGKHYLKYAAKYWDQARTIRIVGKDNAYEAMHWRKSDFRGNTDVVVQTGSALPVSKAARQAMITEFMQLGYIDPTTGLEILEMGAFDKAMEEILVDKKQAQRENLKMSEIEEEVLARFEQELEQYHQSVQQRDQLMAQQQALMQVQQAATEMEQVNEMASEEFGEAGPPVGDAGMPPQQPQMPDMSYMPEPEMPELPVPVNSWDNHEQHIHYHNQFRKTQQFEMLEDGKKRLFELHVQMHQQAIQSPIMGTMGMVGGDPMDPMAQQQGELALAGQQQQMANNQAQFDQNMSQQAEQGSLERALQASQLDMNEIATAQMAEQLRQMQTNPPQPQ